MEEKKYLKWYNKIGYGSGDVYKRQGRMGNGIQIIGDCKLSFFKTVLIRYTAFSESNGFYHIFNSGNRKMCIRDRQLS